MYEGQTTTIKEKPPNPWAARQAEDSWKRGEALIFNSAKIRFFTYPAPRKILFFNTFRLISPATHNGLGYTSLYTIRCI